MILPFPQIPRTQPMIKYPKGVVISEQKKEDSEIVEIDESKMLLVYTIYPAIKIHAGGGELKHAGYKLDAQFDWILVKDSLGALVLVPLKK